MERNYGVHRIQTAEAQFSSIDFLFPMHRLSFQTRKFHKYQSQLCEDHAVAHKRRTSAAQITNLHLKAQRKYVKRRRFCARTRILSIINTYLCRKAAVYIPQTAGRRNCGRGENKQITPASHHNPLTDTASHDQSRT